MGLSMRTLALDPVSIELLFPPPEVRCMGDIGEIQGRYRGDMGEI